MTSPPTDAIPLVRIDWQADNYSSVMADVTDRTLAGSSGVITVEYGRDTARSSAPSMIGVVDLELLNVDRMLSPENPGSPIYQYIKPGRPMQVSQKYGTAKTYRSGSLYRSGDYYRGVGVRPLITGHTNRFQYGLELGNQRVQVSGLASSAMLKRKIVSVAYTGATRTDTAIERVLLAADWPTSMQVMTISDSMLTDFWVPERPAWDVLIELLATEGPGSLLWEDGFGRLRFQNRTWRATATRSTTVQATLHDGTYTGGGLALLYDIEQFGYDPRWDDVVNRVTAETNQRALQASTDIWRMGTDLTLAVGTPQPIKVIPSDPFQNAITPLIGTDYTVSGGTVSITMEETAGAVATLVVTALSGTPTVSGLKVRGQPYTAIGKTLVESTTTSETGEEKTRAMSIWPEIDPAQAKSVTDAYLLRYQDSRPIITVMLQNLDATAQETMLGFEISDRVRIINSHLGLDADAYIERVKHVVIGDGRHVMTLSCEPVSPIGAVGSRWDSGLWDSATWGV